MVRKIIDDEPEGVDKVRLTVPVIYARIRGSNSSLNRKPKRLLEDSLERVLEVVKTDLFGDEEEESVEGDFDGLEEPPVVVCRSLPCRADALAGLQDVYIDSLHSYLYRNPTV